MKPARRLPTVREPAELLAWLCTAMPDSPRSRVKQLLERGRVAVNGQTVTQFNFRIQPGDTLEIVSTGRTRDTLRSPGIRILHIDDDLIAIDKPEGLLTVATDTEKQDTAYARLNAHLHPQNLGRPFVVHRLDRDTSGLLLFARSAAIRDALQSNWDQIDKFYLAVVDGVPVPDAGELVHELREGRDLRVRRVRAGTPGARRAITRYRVLEVKADRSLVELQILTGRKHQIRVQMQAIGCPVAGDPLYNRRGSDAARLALHAARIRMRHPRTDAELVLVSPLPDAIRRIFG